MNNTDVQEAPQTYQSSPRAGRQGVTYEQVVAAVEVIVRANERPTVRGVRERTGGSLGTIQKHFNVWKAKQTPVIQTTRVLSTKLQRTVIEEIDTQVKEETALMEQELMDARTSRDLLAEESDQQAERIAELEGELEQLNGSQQRANGRIEGLEKELEQAREDITAAREEADRLVDEARGETDKARAETESVRVELAKAELRLEQLPILQEDNRVLREKLDAEVIARTTAEKKAAVAEAVADELKGFRQRAADFEGRLQTEHDLRLEAEKMAASLKAELDTERKLREEYTAKPKLESEARGKAPQ